MGSHFEHQGNQKRNPFKSKEGYITSNDQLFMDGNRKLGSDKSIIDQKVAERCRFRGITHPMEIMQRQFAVYSRLYKYRPNYRERQEIRARLKPVVIVPRLDLTMEEMERLLEKLEGANEPILIDIYDKISKVVQYEKAK
jgi:hypothetical protein